MMAANYVIRFKKHLDLSWSDWFDGLTLRHEANGETILVGPLPDQAALYGILDKARNLNLTLVSVHEIPANISEDGRTGKEREI
jgi:hypothetical protein